MSATSFRALQTPPGQFQSSERGSDQEAPTTAPLSKPRWDRLSQEQTTHLLHCVDDVGAQGLRVFLHSRRDLAMPQNRHADPRVDPERDVKARRASVDR